MKNIFKTCTLLYAFLLIGGYSGIAWGSDRDQVEAVETMLNRASSDQKKAKVVEKFLSENAVGNYTSLWLFLTVINHKLPQTLSVLLKYPQKMRIDRGILVQGIRFNPLQLSLSLATQTLDRPPELGRLASDFENDCNTIDQLLKHQPRWAQDKFPKTFIESDIHSPIDLVNQSPLSQERKDALKKLLEPYVGSRKVNSSQPSKFASANPSKTKHSIASSSPSSSQDRGRNASASESLLSLVKNVEKTDKEIAQEIEEHIKHTKNIEENRNSTPFMLAIALGRPYTLQALLNTPDIDITAIKVGKQNLFEYATALMNGTIKGKKGCERNQDTDKEIINVLLQKHPQWAQTSTLCHPAQQPLTPPASIVPSLVPQPSNHPIVIEATEVAAAPAQELTSHHSSAQSSPNNSASSTMSPALSQSNLPSADETEAEKKQISSRNAVQHRPWVQPAPKTTSRALIPTKQPDEHVKQTVRHLLRELSPSTKKDMLRYLQNNTDLSHLSLQAQNKVLTVPSETHNAGSRAASRKLICPAAPSLVANNNNVQQPSTPPTTRAVLRRKSRNAASPSPVSQASAQAQVSQPTFFARIWQHKIALAATAATLGAAAILWYAIKKPSFNWPGNGDFSFSLSLLLGKNA